MGNKVSREYPEGRPGYGEIKPRIIERKDGTSYQVYIGCFKGPDGRRNFVSDEKKKQAQDLLREALNEVDAGTRVQGNETLGQVIDEYIYDCEKAVRRKDISNGHLGREKSSVRLVPERLRRIKMSKFKDSGEIHTLVNDLRDAGYAIRSAKHVRDTLNRVFDYAKRQGYTPRNVIRDYPIKLPKPPKRSNPATIEEARAILIASREHNFRQELLSYVNIHGILCLIMQTGMRPEEAFGLQITDVRRFHTPSTDRPNVWAEATIQHTSTSKDGFQKRTKNDEVRVVPLGRMFCDAWDMIERYWQAHRKAMAPGFRGYGYCSISERTKRYFKELEGVAPERRTHGFLFANRVGTPYNASTVSPLVTKVMRRAGVVEKDLDGRIIIGKDGKPKHKLTLYSFRHMVATHNARHLPAHIGASVTGHDTETYLGTYVHETAGDKILIAESLGELESSLTATKMQQRLITG
jgi:integrase